MAEDRANLLKFYELVLARDEVKGRQAGLKEGWNARFSCSS